MVFQSVRSVRFSAAGADAPLLQGELRVPNADGSVPGVVVAHPHPQRGGSMDNNVVAAICEGLSLAGIASLRFNFRGVGLSEGSYGNGVDEENDVLGALDFLGEQSAIDPDRIGLAGYSFGARVSLAIAPGASSVKALFCVAPPLQEPLAPEQQPSCPFRVLVGDRDRNVAGGVDRYAAFLPSPDDLDVVSGTDHFWWGFEQVIVDRVSEFFSKSMRTDLIGGELGQVDVSWVISNASEERPHQAETD